jgi:hypothetical protein
MALPFGDIFRYPKQIFGLYFSVSFKKSCQIKGLIKLFKVGMGFANISAVAHSSVYDSPAYAVKRFIKFPNDAQNGACRPRTDNSSASFIKHRAQR